MQPSRPYPTLDKPEKNLARANALAYCTTTSVTNKKGFTTSIQGGGVSESPPFRVAETVTPERIGVRVDAVADDDVQPAPTGRPQAGESRWSQRTQNYLGDLVLLS